MKRNTDNQKLLAIVGPTASGKTALSILLAKHFDGEVVSADSRQVYRGFDQTTVKVTEEEMSGVPHHLLNIADITERVSVAEYQKRAEAIIADIQSRGKLPILCGGTGYYIDAVLYDREFPEVQENSILRAELSEKSAEELFKILEELDPVRTLSIERENPRRLIRAIEIATVLGKVPEIPALYKSRFDSLIIGLKPQDELLRERIQKRIETRLDDMIQEIQKEYESGALNTGRASELGFDFSLTLEYLNGKISKEELAKRLEYGDWQYAKRQLRWFKRNPDIQWYESGTDPNILPIVSKWAQK